MTDGVGRAGEAGAEEVAARPEPGATGGTIEHIDISIGGMTCAHCPPLVERELKGVVGVFHARVTLSNTTAAVDDDPMRAKIKDLLGAIRGAGYSPDTVAVRLNFWREETSACSEMVLFPDFNKSANLPTGETVPVEFVPDKPGECEFTCQMGMLRGKLIVE